MKSIRKLKLMIQYGIASGLFFAANAFADETAAQGSLATVADRVRSTFEAVAKVITAGAYIAGMGFVLGAIFKFKAHKDNPTQIPIGTPIALLFIGAAMIFLPSIFNVAGLTLFGSSGEVGGTTGVSSFGSFTAP